uniref:XK-related protein n=2 Tax=Bactrocera latifrons TaxID=174628 RepID=A0A0K8VIT9_BACLA
METAPQKILQISIILMQENQITDTQILSVLLYLSSVPWTLFSYNRCIRAAQPNKNKLSYWNMAPHLCWHFCISLSRILCIAFVAVIFPVWTIVACVLHAVILGFVTFRLHIHLHSSQGGTNEIQICVVLSNLFDRKYHMCGLIHILSTKQYFRIY